MAFTGELLTKLQKEVLIAALENQAAWIAKEELPFISNDPQFGNWSKTPFGIATHLHDQNYRRIRVTVTDQSAFSERCNQVKKEMVKDHSDISIEQRDDTALGSTKDTENYLICHIPTATVRQATSLEDAQVIAYRLRGGKF